MVAENQHGSATTFVNVWRSDTPAPRPDRHRAVEVMKEAGAANKSIVYASRSTRQVHEHQQLQAERIKVPRWVYVMDVDAAAGDELAAARGTLAALSADDGVTLYPPSMKASVMSTASGLRRWNSMSR